MFVQMQALALGLLFIILLQSGIASAAAEGGAKPLRQATRASIVRRAMRVQPARREASPVPVVQPKDCGNLPPGTRFSLTPVCPDTTQSTYCGRAFLQDSTYLAATGSDSTIRNLRLNNNCGLELVDSGVEARYYYPSTGGGTTGATYVTFDPTAIKDYVTGSCFASTTGLFTCTANTGGGDDGRVLNVYSADGRLIFAPPDITYGLTTKFRVESGQTKRDGGGV